MRKLFLIIALGLKLYSGTLAKDGSTLGISNIFAQNNMALGLKIGSASVGTQTYTIAGLNINYFLIDNLSVGLGYEKWFSGDPDISKLTLEGNYYFPVDNKVRPYAGVLYRRIMIGDSDRLNRSFDDVQSYGGRAGVAFVQKNLLLSAGVVHERYRTTGGLFNETETYAELTVGIMF